MNSTKFLEIDMGDRSLFLITDPFADKARIVDQHTGTTVGRATPAADLYRRNKRAGRVSRSFEPGQRGHHCKHRDHCVLPAQSP